MSVDGPVIQVRSGGYVNPLALNARDVNVYDVAHALSNQCRFSGHTAHHYPVAQHAVYVSLCVEERGGDIEDQFWALHHDDTEAYLVDLPRPIKHAPGIGDAYRAIEADALEAIVVAFSLRGFHVPEIVHQADVAVLAAERRDLMPDTGEAWAVLDNVVPYPAPRIPMWSPEFAKTMYLGRHDALESARLRAAA